MPIAELQRDISTIGTQYVYPSRSLHVSLLGCTPREEDKQDPASVRATRIRDAIADVVGSAGPVGVEVGRLNLLGMQLFLEVYTDSPKWARMRVDLADALAALGERPITYADPEPMHLNISRLEGPPDTSRLHQTLGDSSVGLNVLARLTYVDVVVTDFVLSPEGLVIVDTIQL